MAWPPVARSRKFGSYFFSCYVAMNQQYPFQLDRKDSVIMKSVGCDITGRAAQDWVANLFRRKFLPNDWQNATGLAATVGRKPFDRGRRQTPQREYKMPLTTLKKMLYSATKFKTGL
jgi:hypothetical protein